MSAVFKPKAMFFFIVSLILKVSIKNNKPVIFGVLTTNNLNQALERCGGKHGDKGLESAQSLLQVISNCKN